MHSTVGSGNSMDGSRQISTATAPISFKAVLEIVAEKHWNIILI